MNSGAVARRGPRPGRAALWLLALLAPLATGCGKHSAAAPAGGSAVPPAQTKLQRNVELGRAQQQSLTYYVETVGYLEAEGQTDLAAGVSGVVDEVLFREGQWVDQNNVLVKVDQRRYKALLSQAEANVKKAEAALKKAEGSKKRAVAARRDAEQFLALKRVLLNNIMRAGTGARVEERQEGEANVELAAAKLDVAKADVEAADADLNAAGKEVEAANALLELAGTTFDRSQVRAPYAGQINQRRVTVGSFIEDKTVIGTIADLRQLRLVGFVPEKAAPTARDLLVAEQRRQAVSMAGACMAATDPWAGLMGVTAEVRGACPSAFGLEFTLNAYPRRTFNARIFYLSTVANPETHMFECKAEVVTQGLDVELRPGLSARIRCPLRGNASACVIPEESVRATEMGFIAFVPEHRPGKDGKGEWVARARKLELGYRSAGSVEVMKGLSPGEWIVRRGAESLEEGTPVRIPEEQLRQLTARGMTNDE